MFGIYAVAALYQLKANLISLKSEFHLSPVIKLTEWCNIFLACWPSVRFSCVLLTCFLRRANLQAIFLEGNALLPQVYVTLLAFDNNLVGIQTKSIWSYQNIELNSYIFGLQWLLLVNSYLFVHVYTSSPINFLRLSDCFFSFHFLISQETSAK